MSYLTDKRARKKRVRIVAVVVFLLLVLFYFNNNILSAFSLGAHKVFKPVISIGNNIGNNIGSMRFFFLSKQSLLRENQSLKSELEALRAQNYSNNLVVDENIKLKEILGRKGDRLIKLGAVLAKPSHSPYDTLIIDVGVSDDVSEGDLVFAEGNIPLGRIDEAYDSSSKVILFSTPEEKTEVSIDGSDVFLQLVGRGGGNFEIILPRDFKVTKDQSVSLPGINAHTVAIVEEVISDDRDSFTKVLLTTPVNIQALRLVQVEI